MTDTTGPTAPLQRPPKPVPFDSARRVKSAPTSSNERALRSSNESNVSSDSREVLRTELSKRRKSLTLQEQDFLEELVTHGREVDLVEAHKTLCDDDLFFESESTISMGSEVHDLPEPTMRRPDEIVVPKAARRATIASTGGSTVMLGSAERQKHIHERRASSLFGKLWKAHELGLGVARRRRRKSIATIGEARRMVRKSSFLSAETRELIESGGPLDKEGQDDIFRRAAEDLIFRSTPVSSREQLTSSGNSSGNNKVSWKSGDGGLVPNRSVLRRMQSDTSRKSVTFAKVDEDDASDQPMPLPGIPRKIIRDRNVSTESQISELETAGVDDFPPLQHPRPVRSWSLSSIPSLHHGHPIRTESMASMKYDDATSDISVSSPRSIPPVQRAHVLSSESVPSFVSAESVREDESRDPAWAAPLPIKSEDAEEPQLPPPPSQWQPKPVLLRRASRNVYEGVGIEVSELDEDEEPEIEIDQVDKARKYKSLVSVGDNTGASVRSSNSFDESSRRPSLFQLLRPTASEEERSDVLWGSNSSMVFSSRASINTLRPEDDVSWDMDESPRGHFNAWNVLQEDPAVGYGGGLPFRILGTSADDEASTPHVMSPPLMESLQYFVPYALSESNFWMKFSLLRDGASMHALLQKVRGAKHTFIAVETVDGEVFGSFQSDPWRINWKYFGSGEAFLWRMRQSRKTPCYSVIDQARMESEIDVFPWSGENECVQLCTHDKLAVGGGEPNSDEKKGDEKFGFGLALEKELLYGTSSSCATFSSPPLSFEHSDGSPFEIVNLEVWSLTPCMNLEDAEKLELGQLFLRTN